MRRYVPAAILAAFVGALCVSRDAHAQFAAGEAVTPSSTPPNGSSSPPPPPSEAQSRAVLHYERGRSYYAVGRYRSAILELETAIRLDPAGYNLYFDLGLVYERVGSVDEALGAYRHYLEHVTDPAERERAERIVTRLQGARIEIQDMRTRRGRADGWFWAFTAGSVVSLVTGGVVLAADLREPRSPARPTLDLVAGTALSLGGGLALTAVVLYFARDALPTHVPRCITASVDGEGARVGLELHF